MRSWAAGIVALYGSGYLLGQMVFDLLADPQRLESFGWRLGLIYVPNMLSTTLAVLAAAWLIREPFRDRAPLYLTAALVVPVAALIRMLVVAWGMIRPEGIAMAVAAVIFGAPLGLVLDRIREDRGDDNPAPAYPGAGNFRWADRGATATEYMGTIVVVTAVIGAVLATSVGQQLTDGIKAALCRLTGGSCTLDAKAGKNAKPTTDAAFAPKMCNTENTSATAGQEVKIAWFKLGNEYGFQQQKFKVAEKDKNGNTVYKDRIRLTFNEAGKAGVAWEPKFGAKVGKLSEDGKSTVEVGGGVKIDSGDTFQFDTQKEADEFRDKFEQLESAKAGYQYGRDFQSVRSADRYMKLRKEINEKVKGERISTLTVGVEAAGEVKLSGDATDEISAEIGAKVKGSSTASIIDDSINDVTSKSFAFKVEGSGSAKGQAGGTSASAEYGQSSNVALTVTRNKDKNKSLKRIIVTRTVETSGKGGGKQKVDDEDKVADKDKRGKDNKNAGKAKHGASESAGSKNTQTEVVTNMIELDTPEKQRIAQQWLDGSGQYKAPVTNLFTDIAPAKAPGESDPFGQMMFDYGSSTKTLYDGVTNSAELGAELNLGAASFGYTLSLEGKHEKLKKKDATFLGAPRNGKRSDVPMSLCSK
ncbi:hypothetical protein ACFYXH_03145 [Streptomyces sp. NPDC002730]|uniref:hypothetical protein n=1 Tax=Streptomyces sp. NPDC002730 TaxID=3364662 RepID=UPI0036AE4490